MKQLTDEEILALDWFDLCGSSAVFMSDQEKLEYFKNTMSEEVKTQYAGSDKPKVFLVDIDGTVCDDIPNEEPEKFATANPYPDAQKTLKEWKAAGHQIHFFTARREEHREVTEAWLEEHGFEYDSLVMNKPRIKDGEEYVWVDNKKVRAVTYLGKFTQLVEQTKTILVFDEPQEE